MSKLTKILDKIDDPMKKSDRKNFQGAKAFGLDLESQFTQLMFTGGLRNTFYMRVEQIIDMALEVIEKFVRKDEQRASEIAISARNDGFMRDMPVFALSYIKDPKLFETTFPQIVKTPRDLIKFIDITRNHGRGHRGLGRNIKKAINTYILNNLSEFYAIKYRNQLDVAGRLSHVKADDVGKELLLDYIFDNKDSVKSITELGKDSYKMIRGFELFKQNKIDHVEAIETYNLEMQTCIGVRSPTPEVWEAIMHKMSTFQLIKNLNTLSRYVPNDKILESASTKLTIDSLKRGKVLPFRVFQAYSHVDDPFLKNYLGSLANEYPKHYNWSSLGRVCIAPDVSGSMTTPIKQSRSPKDKGVCPATVAGMLSGILRVGVGDNGFLLPWSNRLYQDMHGSVVDIARSIEHSSGGGTLMYLPVEHLIKNNTSVDTFIGITDNEEWSNSSHYSYYSSSPSNNWISKWIEYKRKVNPNAKAFLIRIDPYPHQPFSDEQATKLNIYQIFGWSDHVFDVLLNS